MRLQFFWKTKHCQIVLLCAVLAAHLPRVSDTEPRRDAALQDRARAGRVLPLLLPPEQCGGGRRSARSLHPLVARRARDAVAGARRPARRRHLHLHVLLEAMQEEAVQPRRLVRSAGGH